MLCGVTQTSEYTQEHLEVSGGDRIGLHYYPWAGAAGNPPIGAAGNPPIGAAGNPWAVPAGDPWPEDTTAPVAVIWPAMGTPARYYRRFAAELSSRGMGVLVVDLRGTGTSSPRASRASRYGYAELASDVSAVLDLPSLKGRRIILVGHSLGGQACVLHLALKANAPQAALEAEPRVDGLALVAVGLPYFRVYGRRRSLGVLAFSQGIAGTAAVLGVWPGWGFGGRQARGVISDWGFTARRGRFPQLRGVDVEARLTDIRTPVLAVSVDNDQFTPASTLDHLVSKLDSAPVERVHFTTAEAGAPLDHMIWVRASGPLAARIARFAGLDG